MHRVVSPILIVAVVRNFR